MKSTVLLVVIFALTVSVAAQEGIRLVDFKNFTYEAFCAGEQTQNVKVKDGEFSYEKQMDGYTDRLYFTVSDIAYGDLDGDRSDDAIVLTVCNGGGTGNFSEGLVYKWKDGKPILIANIPGGDRAYGGLKSVKVANSVAVVERYDAGEHGAACCPEYILTERYKLQGGKMIQIGKSARKEIYPKERVLFDKGTAGKTLKVKVPSGDRKRFVVGAKAGQRLTVSAGMTTANIRLLESDDARVTEGVNNFLAVLSKTRDYTIEVSNSSDAEIEVTLTVKID